MGLAGEAPAALLFDSELVSGGEEAKRDSEDGEGMAMPLAGLVPLLPAIHHSPFLVLPQPVCSLLGGSH